MHRKGLCFCHLLFLFLICGYSFASKAESLATIFPNSQLNAARKIASYPQKVYDDELKSLEPDLDLQKDPENYKWLLAAVAAAKKLDIESEQRLYFLSVPQYRVQFVVETIFAHYLKDLIPQPSTNEQKYEKLKEIFNKRELKNFAYVVDWTIPVKSQAGASAFEKIKNIQPTWPELTISFDTLPENYRQFVSEIERSCDGIFRSITRQKVFASLMAEEKGLCVQNAQTVSPVKMKDYFEKHRDDFKRQITDIKLLDLTIHGTKDAAQAERERFLKSFEVMQKLRVASLPVTPKQSELNQERVQFAEDLPLLLPVENGTWTSKVISWPRRQGDAQATELEVKFALNGDLGKVFMPSLHYEDEEGGYHVLLLVGETRRNVEYLDYQSPSVKRQIESILQNQAYQVCARELFAQKLLPFMAFKSGSLNQVEAAESLFKEGRNSLRAIFEMPVTANGVTLPPSKPGDQLKKPEYPPNLPPEVILPKPANPPKNEEPRVGDPIYRFPELHNPNPIAGRLYLQPIGSNDDRVVPGLTVEISTNSYGEYNRKFHDASLGVGEEYYFGSHDGAVSPDLLFMNGNTFQLSLSYGFQVRGYKMEAGAIVRTYLEREDSEMQVFLAWFHGIEGNSPKHIPSPDQPFNGSVGNNRTVVIGKNGTVYVTTADLYYKLQLLEEGKSLKWLPNLSVKLAARVPLSGQPFNTFGMGVSVGLSKHIFKWLTFIAAASVGYQNIDNDSFNADNNLKVNRLTYDLFAGLVIDPGKPGGFYMTAGYRFSSLRMTYVDNPDAAKPAHVLHGSLNYQSRSGAWEVFLWVAEEVPQMDDALEPDFVAGIGFRYRFGTKPPVKEEDLVPDHE